MKVVAPDTEPLEITRAWIGEDDGQPTPFAEIDGRVCFIETKETLLAAGIASCVPTTHTGDDWPHAVQVLEEGSSDVRTIWNATTDPRVVQAARAWAQAAANDEITFGKSLL